MNNVQTAVVQRPSVLLYEVLNEKPQTREQEISKWQFPTEIIALFFKCIARDGFNDSKLEYGGEDRNSWGGVVPTVLFPDQMQEKLHTFSNFSATCKEIYMVSHEIKRNQFDGTICNKKSSDFLIVRSLPFRLFIYYLGTDLNQNQICVIKKLYDIYTEQFDAKGCNNENMIKLNGYHNRIRNIILECKIYNPGEKIKPFLNEIIIKKIVNIFSKSIGSILIINLKSAINVITRGMCCELERKKILYDLCEAIYTHNPKIFEKLKEELKNSFENKKLQIQLEIINQLSPEESEIEKKCSKLIEEILLMNKLIKTLDDGQLNMDARIERLENLLKNLAEFAVFSKDFIQDLDPQEYAEGFLSRHAKDLTGGKLCEIRKILNNVYEFAEDEAKRLALLCIETDKPISEENREERLEAIDQIVFGDLEENVFADI